MYLTPEHLNSALDPCSLLGVEYIVVTSTQSITLGVPLCLHLHKKQLSPG